MKTIEFEKAGKRISKLCTPSDVRNMESDGWEVCQVPSSLNVRIPTQTTQKDDVFKGLYTLEQKMGSSNLAHSMGLGLSASQIKRVWERP